MGKNASNAGACPSGTADKAGKVQSAGLAARGGRLAPDPARDYRACSGASSVVMTAGCQTTGRGHNEQLAPVAFRITISVMAVGVSGSNPSRADAWRCFPSTRLPSIGIAVPPLISSNPDVITAWAKGAVFPDANRWPKPYDDLRMSRYYPKGKAK